MLDNQKMINKAIDEGMINSLEFLKMEADKQQNENLSSILSIARKIASSDPVLNDSLNTQELPDDDVTKAALFIAKFLNSSERSQNMLFDIVAGIEQSS